MIRIDDMNCEEGRRHLDAMVSAMRQACGILGVDFAKYVLILGGRRRGLFHVSNINRAENAMILRRLSDAIADVGPVVPDEGREQVENLARMVAEMRDAQRSYFKVRSPKNLEAAKGLEKEVDGAVAAIFARDKQGTLF